MFRKRQFSLNPVSALFAGLFGGLALYAFDPNDADTKAAIRAAVDEAVAGLDAKNKELLGEVKRLKKGAEIKPEDFERVERERDELATKLDEANKQVKAATKAAETATQALNGEQAFNQRLLIDNGLNAALLEAGVKNPAHLKAAAALLRTSAKVEIKVEGDARKAVVGDKDLAAFVKEWSQSDDGKAFVSAPVNAGGGASGGQGGNPPAGNMGGTAQERAAALAARHPELAANRAA